MLLSKMRCLENKKQKQKTEKALWIQAWRSENFLNQSRSFITRSNFTGAETVHFEKRQQATGSYQLLSDIALFLVAVSPNTILLFSLPFVLRATYSIQALCASPANFDAWVTDLRLYLYTHILTRFVFIIRQVARCVGAFLPLLPS